MAGNLSLPVITETQADKEVTANSALEQLDLALTDIEVIATADADVTLTTTPAGGQALANIFFRFTGAMTVGRTINVPDSPKKLYIINNATTGGFDLTVKRVSGGATTLVQPGNTEILYADGTDVINLGRPIDNLDDLFDVSVASPLDGEVLTFVTAAGQWQAINPAAGQASQIIGGVQPGPTVFSKTVRLSGTAASINVQSIPQNADHLLVIVSGRSDRAAVDNDATFVRLNSDSGSNYDSAMMEYDDDSDITDTSGDGIGVTAIRSPTMPAATSPAGASGGFSFFIPSYTKNDFHKNVQGNGVSPLSVSADGLRGAAFSGRWRNTNSVANLQVDMDVGLWVAGSSVTVIGLKESATSSFNAAVGSTSHALVSMAGDQTTDLLVNDHVEFDTIADSTPDVTLATGAGQADGIVTLPQNKIFAVTAWLPANFSGATGSLDYQIRNNTDAALVGVPGAARTLTLATDEARSQPALAIIDTSAGAKAIEVRITAVTALTSIESTGARILITEIPQIREAPALLAYASLTGNDTITTGATGAELTWDQIEEELGSWGGLSTNTDWVVPSGVERVVVKAQIVWAASAGGTFRRIEVLLNGAVVSPEIREEDFTLDGTDTITQTIVSPSIPVTAADTISIRAAQDSGGNLDVLGTTDRSWFSVEAVKGIGESRVEGPAAFIEAPQNKTYVLDQSAEFPYRIDQITHQMGAGTLSFKIQIDAVDVTGLSGPEPATTSEATDVASAANLVALGGRVTMVVTLVSGASDFGFTMRTLRT